MLPLTRARLLTFTLSLVVSACSDPQCPPGEGKVKSACFPLGAPDAEVDEDAEADVEADAEPARDARIDSSRVDAQPAEASDACGGSCTGGTPVCTPGGQCVACSATERGACTESQQCDVLAGACVECLQQTDCKDPKASVCDSTTHKCKACGVSSVNDCDHVAGKNVCAAGECVECTAANHAACLVGGTQYVCDPSTHACELSRKARSKTLCNTCEPATDASCLAHADCISDSECKEGQACVDVPTGGGQRVCLSIETAAACPRPYAALTPAPVLSADGASVNVCTFRLPTTCQAHREYSNKRCGTPKVGTPSEDQDGSGDNNKCGVAGLDDGYCVFSNAVKQYLCTVPCTSVTLDCPAMDSTSCSSLPHASGTRNLCWL